MTLLVTGARGTLGRRLVEQLTRRGLTVRSAGRTDADVTVDLLDGNGIERALDGVEAVFHCATDPRRHAKVDLEGTRTLLRIARVPVIYPSIVGCDVIPRAYYRSKLAAEDLVLGHPHGGVVVRATQFHQTLWSALERLARLPVMVVPHDTRFQVLDPAVPARLMIDAYAESRRGRLDDIGGPFAYGSKELARSFLAATGTSRPIWAANVPGLVGAAFRAGGNLTESRDQSGESWNQFLEGRGQRS